MPNEAEGQFHSEVAWSKLPSTVEPRPLANGPETNDKEPLQSQVEESAAQSLHSAVRDEGEPNEEASSEARGDIFATMTGTELNVNQIRNFLRDRELIEKEREKRDGEVAAHDSGGPLSPQQESIKPFDRHYDFLNRFIRNTILIESNGKGPVSSTIEGSSSDSQPSA